MSSQSHKPPTFTSSLFAGALAGTTVDLSLYPLDTLKTRLQSPQGFLSAGGFGGIYRGVGSALIGSAPGAALFFCTYESSKSLFQNTFSSSSAVNILGVPGGKAARDRDYLGHMFAASLGEIAACAVRVPTEVVKQRAQARQHASSLASFQHILSQHTKIGIRGVWLELYRGWTVTIMREVPFTVIQFPLWEAMKTYRMQTSSTGLSQTQDRQISALESGLFGSIAGAIAASITTPLDVLKTRMMLAKEKQSMVSLLSQILRDSGPRAFFAGIGPRVIWISAGGAIFLGSYQWGVNALEGGAVL